MRTMVRSWGWRWFLAAAVACAAGGARALAPDVGSEGATAPSADRHAAAEVAATQNAFAVALYRRLGREASGGNLFFSPYSVFVTLAMTAEGAREETAAQMGEALGLPPSLHSRGPDAAARPWDLAPVHAGLGAFAREIERRSAGDTPESRARIDSLRVTLAVLGELASRPPVGDGHTAYGGDYASHSTELVVSELNGMLPGVELSIASSLWGDAAYPLAPRFVQTLAEYYGTQGMRSVDFQRHPEAARDQINAWVAGQTRQRILDLLPPRCVDEMTGLVLANAIYFKGRWAELFDESLTRQEPFRLADGGQGRAALMQHWLSGGRYGAFRADGRWFATPREIAYDSPEGNDDPLLYPGRDGFQVVEVPYRGGELAMVAVLPASPADLATLEDKLTAERLAAWINKLERRSVRLKLPRCKLEQGRELGKTLRAMGMVRAFTLDAEFNGMIAGNDPANAFHVSAVFHKAFVEVNERGTEAAAATAVDMRSSGITPMTKTRPFVPAFVADHPFLFLIRDVASGNILFMGRFARP